MLAETKCPNCLRVRLSQGFIVTIVDDEPLCDSCAQWKADKEYYESSSYQLWLSSIPEGLTIEERSEWVNANPPPERR